MSDVVDDAEASIFEFESEFTPGYDPLKSAAKYVLEMSEVAAEKDQKIEALQAELDKYKVDSLTEAFVRRKFDEDYQKSVSEAMFKGTSLGLAIFDIKGLKGINDTIGHDKGDLVLKGAVEAVKKNIRTTDSIYRLGGDEFGIIFPHPHLEESQVTEGFFVSRIEEALEGEFPDTISAYFAFGTLRPGEDGHSLWERVHAVLVDRKDKTPTHPTFDSDADFHPFE